MHANGQADQPPNPFFSESPLPLHYPQFDRIQDSHFAPAFDAGMAEQLKEIDAIANNEQAPTFDDTLVALELSGQLLDRATTVFSALVGADTNDARNELRKSYSTRFAAHNDAIHLNPRLFARIDSLYQHRAELKLDAEAQRLIERYHSDFIRAGAKLSDGDKSKLKQMNAELAALGSQFSQNVLDEVNAAALVVDDVKELDGLTPAQIAAAADEAKSRGLAGNMSSPSQHHRPAAGVAAHQSCRAAPARPPSPEAARVAVRQPRDREQTMKLRAERARLLGYANHAAYALENQTARTPEAANRMLRELAPAAVANARREAADLQAVIDKEGGGFQLEPWDWAYYSEKVRVAKYAFDESQLKPYLELTNVLENGVFFAANQLYGLTFRRRGDLPVYHPDVKVYDVLDANGEPLAHLHSRPVRTQIQARWRLDEFVCVAVDTHRPPAGGREHAQHPEASGGRADAAHLG
jgi:peptidyl-dipeptidase Dcp